MVQLPLVGQDLHIIEASRSRSDTTLGKTPLDEWQVCRRDSTDNPQHSHVKDIHAPGGFEPTIPGNERPQTHALDRGASGTGILIIYRQINFYAKINDKFSYIL